MHLAEHERPDFFKFLRLSVEVLERIDADRVARVGKHFRFAQDVEDFQHRGLRAAAAEVPAGDQPRVRRRICHHGCRRRLVRVVAVQKGMPQRVPRADFPLARAVVGNEESHLLVQNQVQIAVEVIGVAGMPNDSVPIPALLIEAQRHAVHVGQVGKLPRVHQPCRFRAQNLCSFILAVLQMGNHEARHVRTRDRGASRRRRFHELEVLRRL